MKSQALFLFLLAIVAGYAQKLGPANLPATRAMADAGNPNAQSLLGIAYYEGRGVRRNFAEAGKWFLKAAEQGVAQAEGYLGLMYQLGQGVPQDFAESVKWYGKAAEQGDVDAQWRLGVMYNTGRGVPQDFVQAYMWVNIAASRASGAQQFVLAGVRDRIAMRMTADQTAMAQELARAWKPSGPENAK